MAKEKETEKEKAKKETWNINKKEKETVKRKMVRITHDCHEKAKWNPHKMQLQKYIEALVDLDYKGAVDWSKHTEDEA